MRKKGVVSSRNARREEERLRFKLRNILIPLLKEYLLFLETLVDKEGPDAVFKLEELNHIWHDNCQYFIKKGFDKNIINIFELEVSNQLTALKINKELAVKDESTNP